MFTLYIVFDNGHAIILKKMEFAQNAIDAAKYHQVWAKPVNAWFEVVTGKGEIVYSTAFMASV